MLVRMLVMGLACCLFSCGSSDDDQTDQTPGPTTDPTEGAPAGEPGARCDVPDHAQLIDTSNPTTVVGAGSAESCTSEAFVEAVAQGGIITFDCGPDPVVITLEETAKVFNDAADEVVIDGGGMVTLSGAGERRILYMNTCDEDQVWTTSHCQNQDHPRLTVQNLTFVDADARSHGAEQQGGGGAIWARGGRLTVLNSRFFNNRCAEEGPDVGGGAIRAFSQFEGRPVHVVNSTFGGADNLGNSCSNGGALSSIGVSWTIVNSVFVGNRAVGNGGNPAQSGTPGGGSGGAIYNDGNTMTLKLCGSRIENNSVNAHGAGVFFVTNDRSGNIVLEDSVIRNNDGGSWYALPGISMHEDTDVSIDDDTILE